MDFPYESSDERLFRAVLCCVMYVSLAHFGESKTRSRKAGMLFCKLGSLDLC